MKIAYTLQVSDQFDRGMAHCDNLISLHQKSGGGARGRRHEGPSANRAVIVMAIASWQALVQDATMFLLDRHTPSSPSDPNYGMGQLIKGQVKKEIGNFSTPNAQNSRRLLQLVGYDPRPYWSWNYGGGKARGTYTPSDVEAQLQSWLRVRHAIAHGDETMPVENVLESVRQNSYSSSEGPTIRLSDAQACIRFIRKLVTATSDGLLGTFAPPTPPTPPPPATPPTP